MEISIKAIGLLSSIILTGLSAGFFVAWSVSVIPGTLKVADIVYLETMQSINRAILNPVFFLVFFGSVILLFISTVLEFNTNKPAFYLMLAATLVYLFGTIGVTGMGNVPLNNQLDVMNLKTLGSAELSEFRQMYETDWNRLHTYKTVFAVIAFILAIIGLWAHTDGM